MLVRFFEIFLLNQGELLFHGQILLYCNGFTLVVLRINRTLLLCWSWNRAFYCV